jgi:hypothetical protein
MGSEYKALIWLSRLFVAFDEINRIVGRVDDSSASNDSFVNDFGACS